MRPKKLLVCDLDNTLYDWVGYFVPSFNAMVDAALPIIECDREKLLDDLREVHQRHHDSEHPFALIETSVVQRRFAGMSPAEMAKVLDPAFHAFNSMRKRTLKLNPGVMEGLSILHRAEVILIAHTESKLYGAFDRLSRLKILQYFRKVYCRERPNSIHPNEAASAAWLKKVPMYLVRELAHHQAKPDPDVLLEICRTEGVEVIDVAYVGDSIARDILMAKRAGVFAIWAEYGARHDHRLYADLVRVTHWTQDEVAREERLRAEAKSIRPDYTASSSFLEVLTALGIGIAEVENASLGFLPYHMLR
jgi:FMN phosphatase YigB (HAD superfamily)